MKAKIFSPVIAAILILCGCRSDQYYHEQASERARKHLLENSRHLTSEQINHIRFNAPFILHAPVLDAGTPVELETAVAIEKHQICFGWLLPDRKDVLMVFGVSNSRMDDWYPNRIISRRFDHQDPPLVAAAKKCVDYAQQNLFNLMNPREINQVRFTFPYLVQSSFGLNINPEGKLTAEELKLQLDTYSTMTEFSIVWKLNRRNLVFSGYATSEFQQWNILFADFVNDEELAKCTVKEIMTPSEALNPFPVAEQKNISVENPPAEPQNPTVEEKK